MIIALYPRASTKEPNKIDKSSQSPCSKIVSRGYCAISTVSYLYVIA